MRILNILLPIGLAITGAIPTSNALKAVAVLVSSAGVQGTIYFEQTMFGGPTAITGYLSGLTPGLHGFHVHDYGDLTDGCENTGPHFNPWGMHHGGPDDLIRHAGDLGNINVGDRRHRQFYHL